MRILDKTGKRLSPTADGHVEEADRLCGVNLAQKRAVLARAARSRTDGALGNAACLENCALDEPVPPRQGLRHVLEAIADDGLEPLRAEPGSWPNLVHTERAGAALVVAGQRVEGMAALLALDRPHAAVDGVAVEPARALVCVEVVCDAS